MDETLEIDNDMVLDDLVGQDDDIGKHIIKTI